jgi:hypothetical protein
LILGYGYAATKANEVGIVDIDVRIQVWGLDKAGEIGILEG